MNILAIGTAGRIALLTVLLFLIALLSAVCILLIIEIKTGKISALLKRLFPRKKSAPKEGTSMAAQAPKAEQTFRDNSGLEPKINKRGEVVIGKDWMPVLVSPSENKHKVRPRKAKKGAPIPLFDEKGNRVYELKKTRKGEIVLDKDWMPVYVPAVQRDYAGRPLYENVPYIDPEKARRTAAETGDFNGFNDDLEASYEQFSRTKKAEDDLALAPDRDALLEVRHLKMYFPLKKSISGKVTLWLRAVDDVSFKLHAGETLGIVGESGCGKTTMGRAVLKLYRPTDGQIFFGGQDIAKYTSKQMRPLRTKMQIIFQDPYSSLPPRSTVGGILSEPVKVHKIVPKGETKDYVLKIMEQCGLRDYYYERYPHEFSGGQRQRICIARALSVAPQLVICDEPVSALDVSIQAQIINLLKRLQEELGLTYVFISHDLSVVKYISDRIGVMYLGSMVEFGDKHAIFSNPMHPYTQALFSAVPNPNPDVKMDRIVLSGDIPSPANPPKGCKFNTRCPCVKEICKHIAPVYKEYEPGHFVACHCYPQED